MDGDPKPRPLAGVTVLDLTRVVSGPIASRMLADLGADVIKVEAADGDVSRTVGPIIDGVSPYFAALNVGKRDVSIDVRNPEGARLVRELAASADVLIENFRPGVLDRAGLGPADALAANPSLVYCSVTGWGHANCRSDDRSYAPLVHAETGRIELAARLRGGEPVQEVHVHGDIYPGLFAVTAIVTALYQRTATGLGQHLDVSMAETTVWANEWAASDLAGFDRDTSFDIWTNPIGALADDTLVTIVGNPTRSLSTWVAALGGDPPPEGLSVRDAIGVIRGLLRRVPDMPTLESMTRGHPMMIAEVRSVGQLAATEWARERHLFYEAAPGVRVPSAPFRSSAATIGPAGHSPGLGEHTREVLHQRLGLSDAELDGLESSGAILRNPASGDRDG